MENLPALFDRSAALYEQYRQGGRNFRLASALFDVNQSIRSLLRENRNKLPAQLRRNVDELEEHYEAWSVDWELERVRLAPGPDDLFAFPTRKRFPKQSEAKLREYFSVR